jgi:hypothetical protein
VGVSKQRRSIQDMDAGRTSAREVGGRSVVSDEHSLADVGTLQCPDCFRLTQMLKGHCSISTKATTDQVDRLIAFLVETQGSAQPAVLQIQNALEVGFRYQASPEFMPHRFRPGSHSAITAFQHP